MYIGRLRYTLSCFILAKQTLPKLTWQPSKRRSFRIRLKSSSVVATFKSCIPRTAWHHLPYVELQYNLSKSDANLLPAALYVLRRFAHLSMKGLRIQVGRAHV